MAWYQKFHKNFTVENVLPRKAICNSFPIDVLPNTSDYSVLRLQMFFVNRQSVTSYFEPHMSLCRVDVRKDYDRDVEPVWDRKRELCPITS